MDVLDLPSGFGRHSLFLAAQGGRVTAADIDRNRLAHSVATWQASATQVGELYPVCVNAELPLPFQRESFDLVLVVHYVSHRIVEAVWPLVRPNGFLLYETFGAQGENRSLLPTAGSTALRVADFEVLDLRERPVSGNDANAVTVKMLATKKR